MARSLGWDGCTAGLGREHHRRKAAQTWLQVNSSAPTGYRKKVYDLNLFKCMSLREARRSLASLPDLPFVSYSQTHNHTHLESMWAQSLSF